MNTQRNEEKAAKQGMFLKEKLQTQLLAVHKTLKETLTELCELGISFPLLQYRVSDKFDATEIYLISFNETYDGYQIELNGEYDKYSIFIKEDGTIDYADKNKTSSLVEPVLIYGDILYILSVVNLSEVIDTLRRKYIA